MGMKHFMQPRNTIMRELYCPTVYGVDSSVSSLDSVRMRLVNKEEEEGEMIVQKVGNDALEINGQTFTFDSVADIDST
ncbi:hypothetical protein Pint_26710 [Pistacia integerrima]|uniref:Uncharacterized protein n=1 Tax=Pistacia integerrima TaxID=434235 RepID=A0ACC0YMC3_9ROSI|nr:hypothetical protein Pint_26710 [Pistacia integerrima]